MRNDLRVNKIKTSDLIPYVNNARTHSDEQVAQIAASIKEFGFNNPVLIDGDNGIIAGHGRVLAARKLGLDEVPAVALGHLTDSQKKAYILADNKLALNAGWDDSLLGLELTGLDDEGFDLSLIGFDADELASLMGEEGEAAGFTDEDAVPETPETPVTKDGDVWILGDHRLMCGDSTDAGAVAILMNGEKAGLLQTDPPYGIAYVKNAKSKNQAVSHGDIENDELDGEALQEFLENTIKAALPNMRKRWPIYLWHPMLTQGTFFAAAAAAADILINRQIVWIKPSMVFGRGDYHWRHELCFYGWVRGEKPVFYGERNQTTIWELGRETSKEHPTAKPVKLWVAPIRNHLKPGEVMYEPFSGSGSQIIAAEETGRKCYAMELSAQYVDVAVKRWQEFTGRSAVLDGTDKSFATVSSERL